MNGHWHAPLCMDKLINYFSTQHLEVVALLCAHLRKSAWKKATWVPGKGGVNQVLALYLEIVYTVHTSYYVTYVKVEKSEKYPFTLSLSAVTSGFLWRLTGNTRRYELDPGGYGGVTCPLGLHYCSVSSKLRLKPPAFTSSLQPVVVSHGHKRSSETW